MAFTLTLNATVSQLMASLIPASAGISYQNEKLEGDPRCAALYKDVNTVLGAPWANFPDEGFVLGTGDAEKLYDQNGTQTSTNFGTPGDSEILPTSNSSDACVLSFDFKCDDRIGGDDANLFISYAFASDEYKEQIDANNGFNDQFALLLNGNNTATVPNTDEYVSVYTINHLTNTEYFVFNNPRPEQAAFPGFEPDGFTKGLDAVGPILGGWNSMKIGIVDGGVMLDSYLDSWVFLQKGSFECKAVTQGPSVAPSISKHPSSAPTRPEFGIPQSCSTGNACGDPHFRTFDDQFFSYHGQCDLVLTRSKNSFASGLGLDVHIRTTRVNNPHVDYSYISGAAVKIGTDVLEVSEEGDLTINGNLVDPPQTSTFAGIYPINMSMMGSKQRIIAYELDLGNDMSIQIRANTKTGMLFVDVNGAFADSEGLLGAAPEEGKPLLARDGVTDLTGHWNTYGEEWQVNDVDPKLFQDSERHPQYPESCSYKADEMKKSHFRGRRRLMETNKVSLEAATDACTHLEEGHMKDFCVNDIMATGDLDLVEDPFYANN